MYTLQQFSLYIIILFLFIFNNILEIFPRLFLVFIY
nr:MAG TPA_asm: hypothetical protein [Caudoviricetes sp.]